MKFGIVGPRRDQCAIDLCRVIKFAGLREQVSKIALRFDISRRELESGLQFGNRLIFLALGCEYASKLQMESRILWTCGGELAQERLCLGRPSCLHVDIDEAHGGLF